MLYLDTSVRLAWTLTQSAEPNRAATTKAFVARLEAGALVGATSFYALHDVYLFAVENAPNFPTWAAFGKAALEQIRSIPLRLLPFVSRIDSL